MNECVCLCSNNSLFTKTVEQKFVVVVVQSLSRVWPFVTPWTAARQASLSFLISWSLLKLMSLESVMPSNHLILCHPFSSGLQSFPASGSFPMSRLFASGQSIGASASVLPMNIQGWFPWGLTGLISLLSKGLSRFVVGKFYLSKAIKAAKQPAQCIWPVGHSLRTLN